MGQAKLRGTYEERRIEAIARDQGLDTKATGQGPGVALRRSTNVSKQSLVAMAMALGLMVLDDSSQQ